MIHQPGGWLDDTMKVLRVLTNVDGLKMNIMLEIEKLYRNLGI